MSSETTMAAEQCRLREWAVQIRDCQSRPAGMSVVEWRACHGVTKANYYYRLRRVRQACLENIPGDLKPQIVPVEPGILQMYEKDSSHKQPGLDISIKGVSIHVTGSTSMPLLAEVLKVVRHCHSPRERWCKTLDGFINYTDIKYDVPAGKYLLSIKGYVRKKVLDFPAPIVVFSFLLWR